MAFSLVKDCYILRISYVYVTYILRIWYVIDSGNDGSYSNFVQGKYQLSEYNEMKT